jgi:hypothetical protein
VGTLAVALGVEGPQHDHPARPVYSRGAPLRSPWRWRAAGTRLANARLLRLVICLCTSLILLSFLFPAQASARTKNAPVVLPTLQIAVGFEDDSRLNYWTPVQVTLSNEGSDFKGVLSVTTYAGISRPVVVGTILPWSYQASIALARGTQKQINLYVPFYESPAIPQGIIATLSGSNGKVISTQTAKPFTLVQGSLLIGILSDHTAESSGFSSLSNVSLPDPARSIELASLNVSTMPDVAEVLDNFDVIVLDDFTTSSLNSAQLSALQTWINRGGVLIEVGGSDWNRTLGALPPQLLPVIMHGTGILPAGTHLLPTGSPTISEIGQKTASDTLRQSISISTAALPGSSDTRQEAFSNIETVLGTETNPLIVQAHQGQGVICYLAFDLAVAPLANWPGTSALWKGLLLRTLGDQSLIPAVAPTYPNGPGQSILRGGLFQILQPGTLFPVIILVILLLGYIIVIGPIRFFIVHNMSKGERHKRTDWNWRIILSSIVVFSLLTYGLAYIQTRPIINSISIVQVNQGGDTAHVTNFFSPFLPGEGNFQIHVPAKSLAQPITNALFQSDSRVPNVEEDVSITVGQNETNINLPNLGPWTLHNFVSEEDQKLQGRFLSHLALHNNILSGTVTNELGTDLKDVYILMNHSFVYIGNLPSGQTQQVNVSLHSSTLSASSTLADQIAKANHLPVPYFPFASGKQPENDFQRHLAILSALSGEGFTYPNCNGPCSTYGIAGKHLIFTPLFGQPKLNSIDGNDPLLVTGAPATLIGWAGQHVDTTNDVTVNGASPGGTHEDFVQVPLNVDLSSLSSLPPGFINGQVINAQGNGVQTTSAGVYTINTGSITFEFTLPGADYLQVNNLTISEPIVVQTAGNNQAQARLYNWNTNSWDAITLNNFSFTTTNIKAYTSSNGRVLFQVVNQNASQSALYFGKPSLSLNNAVN